MAPIRSGNLRWASHTARKGSAFGRGKGERNTKKTLSMIQPLPVMSSMMELLSLEQLCSALE